MAEWVYLWLTALTWLTEAGISPWGPKQVFQSWVPLLGSAGHSSFAFFFVYWYPCPNSLSAITWLWPVALQGWEMRNHLTIFHFQMSSSSILKYFCTPSAELGDWNRDGVPWFIYLILPKTVMKEDKDCKLLSYQQICCWTETSPWTEGRSLQSPLLTITLLTTSYVGTKQPSTADPWSRVERPPLLDLYHVKLKTYLFFLSLLGGGVSF